MERRDVKLIKDNDGTIELNYMSDIMLSCPKCINNSDEVRVYVMNTNGVSIHCPDCGAATGPCWSWLDAVSEWLRGYTVRS